MTLESGCFWRALPEKGLAKKGKACHGGKESKVRVTDTIFVNAAGNKEKPLLSGISKAEQTLTALST